MDPDGLPRPSDQTAKLLRHLRWGQGQVLLANERTRSLAAELRLAQRVNAKLCARPLARQLAAALQELEQTKALLLAATAQKQ